MLHRRRTVKAKYQIAIGIIVALATIITIATCALTNKMEVTETTRYTVQSGDSLWSIVVNECPSEYDTREVILWIKDNNSCTNYIQPGQQLTIPVFN